jgi:hypothetical protein
LCFSGWHTSKGLSCWTLYFSEDVFPDVLEFFFLKEKEVEYFIIAAKINGELFKGRDIHLADFLYRGLRKPATLRTNRTGRMKVPSSVQAIPV